MARDPVCGMNVRDDNRDNNLRSDFRGQQYYFCSDKCRREFDRNPSNFVRDDSNDRRDNNRNDLRNNRDNNRNRDDNRPR